MRLLFFLASLLTLISCTTSRSLGAGHYGYSKTDPPLTKSLFNDKNATISEENIQKILDGSYSLPEELRISIVKLDGDERERRYYWSDETYLKSQQAYLDKFMTIFSQSDRTKSMASIPDILISNNPTFTSIRESAVRTQADIVVIYSINSDIYSRFKLFSKSDIKAFATTQLIILDVRTGLIPFTTIVTRDIQSKRQKEELNDNEAASRIKNEAILLTIEAIGRQLEAFLKK